MNIRKINSHSFNKVLIRFSETSKLSKNLMLINKVFVVFQLLLVIICKTCILTVFVFKLQHSLQYLHSNYKLTLRLLVFLVLCK